LSKKRKYKRPNAPDEYCKAGFMEFARFGRLTVGRSHLSQEQHEIMRNDLASGLPNFFIEIDALVKQIAAKVACLPPGELLHHAWWEFARAAIDFGEKKLSDIDVSSASRMVDYIQSVIVSVAPGGSISNGVSEEDWCSLKEDVATLFTRLTLEYQARKTADLLLKDPQADMELEGFRFRAETLWLNVRGKRYQSHEMQALIEILTPHTDILNQLFGIDAMLLVRELNKVLIKLTSGVQNLFGDLKLVQEKVLDRCQQIVERTGIKDFNELRDKVYEEDQGLAAQMAALTRELCGLDFFDLEKITCLPRELLDELAWSQGEEQKFFAPGEFCGWPMRIWPIMQRPFIRLDNKILCFDMFSLFDNIYRALQRIIFRLAPSYKQTWLKRQQDVSEELPFTYFQRLLPDARIFRSVYYYSKTGSEPAKWCEADGLLIYEDHLFIIEVKAGSFTYTSPADDFPAQLVSLDNLVQKPVFQGNRFFDYLESADEVVISNEARQEIARLRRSDFRHITICAVTLDPITEIAARSQHLQKIGIEMGQRSVWVLSIDDMRVYADLFDNPLVFLHFVEQRMLATRSELLDLTDEVSHIGLYIAENNYSEYAKKLVGDTRVDILTLDHYQDPVNEYYRAIVFGSPIPPPKQIIPPRFAEFIDFLVNQNLGGRAKLASFLLDIEKDLQFDLSAAIDKHLSENTVLGRPQPISTQGHACLTLYCWSPAAPRKNDQALYGARVVMVLNKEVNRLLLELEYDDTGILRNMHWQEVSLAGLSQGIFEGLTSAAEVLRQQRVTAALRQRKIGRNDPCPCASGKKYKWCCERSCVG
jgi:hypothetical protein